MEKNKSVTAVEWLVEQLSIEHRVSLIEKAKEMERQQIVDAFENGYENGACLSDEDPIYHGEQYYNETFGK